MVAGGVRVAGQCVADEDGVGPVGVQLAVGLVGDLDRRQPRAGLERERRAGVEEPDPPGLDPPEAGRVAQPRLRFEEITPVSKPAR